MVSKKKALLLIFTLTFILIASVTGMIVVLVSSSGQSAESVVNIRYQSSDVHVEISASVTVGDSTTDFVDGSSKTLELSPEVMSGVLSQPNNANSINLTRDNSKAVFMYSFKNLDDDADVKIVLKKIPTNTNGEKNINLNIYYTYSDTLLSNLSTLISSDTTYTNQLLPAYPNEYPTKYVYVIAEVDNKLNPADLMGSFEWELTRATDSEVATYTIDMTGVDMVERATTNYVSSSIPSTMTYKTMSGATDIDIDLVPFKSNGVFLGYATSSSATTPDAILMPRVAGDDNHNIIASASSQTIYPVFATGTVPSSSYSYSNGSYIVSNTKLTASIPHFVVPDYYNNGTNGLAKVTAITDGTSTSNGVMNSNTSVTKITLGRYLTNLGKYSFYNCTNVVEVNYYPTNVTTSVLKNDAWYNVGGNTTGVTMTIYGNVENVPFGFLHNSTATRINLKSCIFEDSDTPLTILGYAFHGMKATSINFPERLVSLASSAVESSQLTSLYIPKNVKSIGSLLTFGCSNLASITVDENNQYYDSRESCNAVVETATNKIIAGCKNSTFPSTVTTIGRYAFTSQSSRTELTIPANIKLIEAAAFRANTGITSLTVAKGVYVGDSAFENCSMIQTFDVKASVIETKAFYNCTKLTDITVYAETVGDQAFSGCTRLTNVTFAYGVETIGNQAFYGCSNITSISLPSTVSRVGDGCFYECTSLSTFTIANGVEYLGEYFIEGSAVTSLYIPSSVTHFGRFWPILTSLEFADVGATWRSDSIYPEDDMYWVEPQYATSSDDFAKNADEFGGGPGDYFMWVKQV